MAAAVPGERSSLNGSKQTMPRHLPPKAYADALSAYSHQGIETTLYPGHHFIRLADYLQKAGRNNLKWNSSSSRKPFPFAWVYLLDDSAHSSGRQYENPDEITSLAKAGGHANSVLFLRGQPSPEWLSAIGGMYLVDPDFFQRHLEFLFVLGRPNYLPTPSLPSVSKTIIQLRYITIGQDGTYNRKRSPDMGDAMTKTGRTEMNTYLSKLQQTIESGNGLGNSIVRDFHVFEDGHFAIEQAISLCVCSTGSNWTAMAWLDTGRDLSHEPRGPWSEHLAQLAKNSNKGVFLPTIQVRSHLALRPNKYTIDPKEKPNADYSQSASLLHLNYGKILDKDLMAHDAFYAFHELFLFCAFSETQFINMLETKIPDDDEFDRINSLPYLQSKLIYLQKILYAHSERLHSNIDAILSRGGSSWPRPSEDALQQRCIDKAKILQKDYEFLVDRVERLSVQCKSKMALLMNRAILAESNKAMIQAEGVTKLTRLAFIFIPTSFTAAFFSMELYPISSGAAIGLWVWFVVTLPLVLLCFAFLKWDAKTMLRVTTRGRLFQDASHHNGN